MKKYWKPGIYVSISQLLKPKQNWNIEAQSHITDFFQAGDNICINTDFIDKPTVHLRT